MPDASFRRPVSLAAVVLALGFGFGVGPRAGRADEKAEVKGDLKALQGEWVSKDEQGESTWVFKGDHCSIKTPSRGYEMPVSLDGAARPEKSIDFKVLDDSPNAKGANGKAIYKIDGAKVVICMGVGDGDRPREFKNDFPQTVLFELKKK